MEAPILAIWVQLSGGAEEDIRGVLGNKCAGQHNLKTVGIREMMWK